MTQILHVVAPQAEAKPQQPSDAQGREFQQLLARASKTGDQRGPAAVEAKEVEEREEPAAENADQDAATSQDDQSTTPPEVPVLATAETEQALKVDLPGELPLDEVLWSEAAGIVLAAQASPAADFPVESVDTTPEPHVAATVIEASTTDDRQQETPAKPPAAVHEFTQTLDASQAAQQVVANEPVVADSSAETPAKEQTGTNLQTAELVDGLAKEPAAESPGDEPASQTQKSGQKAVAEVASAGLPTQEAIVEKQEVIADKEVVSVKTPKSVQPLTEQAEETPVEETAATSDKPETAEKPPGAPSVDEVAPLQQETRPADETKVTLDKETKPVSLTHELPASNHGSSEALSRTTQGTHLSANQSAAPTDSGVDSDPVSTLDRARFVQRVTRAFQSAHARDGVIQLRLSPPELGSLRIAISTHQGVVSAKVEADTAAARNVILDNLPALRERLAEQQIRLEKFDVDVRRDGDQDTGNWNAQDRQSPRFAERPGGPTRLRQPTALPVQAGRALGGVNESGLDVRI